MNGYRRASFRPKRIGLGWTPASWQGWLLTAGIVGAVVLVAALLRH